MGNIHKINIVYLLVGLGIALFFIYIGFKWDYPSYEHTLNETNPLILSEDFVICDQNNYYDLLKNLSNYDIDFTKICEKRYQEEIWFKAEGGIIKSTINLDSFFSGSEITIQTNGGDYLLTKLDETKEGVLIRVKDKTQGKKPLWEK